MLRYRLCRLVVWGCPLGFSRGLIPALVVLAGCTKTVPTKVLSVPPPALPHIEQHIEPLPAAIPSELTYPKEPRLQQELTVSSRVNALELSALREGDEFTDKKVEHAAIDDLKNVETFPALIDPTLKREVEDDVEEISYDLPIEINYRVLGFLDYYQSGRGHSIIELGLQRAGRFQPMIERILKEEGVPLDLIYLCQAESSFEPRAVSVAQAKGMWQFIASRGKEYGLRQTWWIDERSDPEKSTRAAARHLRDLYQQFADWYVAMAAYNSGPLRVQRALERTGADNFWTLADKKALPKETINYVPNILALSIIGKNPEKYGFNVIPEVPLETERVSVDKATDLRVIAEAINLPLEDLRQLNTHVLRWTTPPDDVDFQLILPKGYSDKFNEQISSLPDSKRVLFRQHVVRKGDTLESIARRYGTTVSQLIQANNLGKSPVLQVSRLLVIPMSGITPPQLPGRNHSARTVNSPATSSWNSTAAASYAVRPGDTLAKIAVRFNTTVEKLKSWNHLTSTRLIAGRRLIVSQQPVRTASSRSTIGKKVVHRVQQGDTLDRIATTYNTSVDAILSLNESEDLSIIHPGDRITISLGDTN